MVSSTSITNLKHIHFTGIKGVAMTALAICAKDLGIKVTGSDVADIFVTDETLKKHGISWMTGFNPVNLDPKPDLVIFTGAHGGFNNPEVVAAKGMGIPILSHAEALGMFIGGKTLLTVAGVGGKTTTASMIASLLSSAGRNPSFAVGVADIFSLGTPGRYDKKGEDFVTEADEFAVSPGVDNRPRFVYQNPTVLVVTNIEHDHPDIYPTFEDTKKVFLEFMKKIPSDGLLVACIDNENVRNLIKEVDVSKVTYGFSKDADWRVSNIEFKDRQSVFTLTHKGEQTDYTLNVPGRYNILNATAAIIACSAVGVTRSDLVTGIKEYKGCKRRVEFVREKDGVLFYDDFAHHPTEIRAALKAFREWFPRKRIIAVFQPHTYSRTKVLFSEFAESFASCDKVYLMDIYASARETDTLGVTSKLLAGEIAKHHPDIVYTASFEETAKSLAETLQDGDVVITMGGGDVYNLHDNLLKL
jgi:UDP-N-acetylmuramate--alanine ligase